MAEEGDSTLGRITPNFTLVGMPGNYRLGEVPPVVPVLPVRDSVIFPFTLTPLVVTDLKSIELVNNVVVGDRLMAIVSVREEGMELRAENLFTHGTLAYVHRLMKGGDSVSHVVVQGLMRVELREIITSTPFIRARISRDQEAAIEANDTEGQALLRNLKERFNHYVALSAQVPEELLQLIGRVTESRQLAYQIASSLSLELKAAQEVLAFDEVVDKVRRLTDLISREIEILELGQHIRSQAKSEIEKTQREYILRQQMKAIQNELGEGNEQRARADEFREKIARVQMPPEAEREAQRELARLETMGPASAEYPMVETYLEWMTEVPWSKTTDEILDLARAREVLDTDHYGLEDIKDRILEYLSVRKLRAERRALGVDEAIPTLRPEREGAILCFAGPPGVGKTSLGASIARAIGRKFVRMSLGGLRDEAEIRGHRRTYIGAAPGRVVQAMRRVGSKNPVFMLDEIDKVGSDWRGDPSSALLEVLDPEQNREFRDNYLNVPFDLSQVLFIATANVLDTIPGPLRDRMEILQLSGYTDLEKLHIARSYLVPRQVSENGLRSEEVRFEDDALLLIIREYTREAGVRDLERQIGRVCRKSAVSVVEGGTVSVVVDAAVVRETLGKTRFHHEAKERTEIPGVAIGLAFTPVGGEILFVEASRMEGDSSLTVTGQVGEVMKESARAALSLVRSKAAPLGVAPEAFSKSDVHVHVPAGAVPKDGPSAGIALATALASLFTGRTVRGDLGMTGEVTLRGKVLPVGGIKEKVIAAHRAELGTVILPRYNEKDIDDLPAEVRSDLEIHFVDNIEQVFELALEPLAVSSEQPAVSWHPGHARPH